VRIAGEGTELEIGPCAVGLVLVVVGLWRFGREIGPRQSACTARRTPICPRTRPRVDAPIDADDKFIITYACNKTIIDNSFIAFDASTK
jgi:hypothetical protein